MSSRPRRTNANLRPADVLLAAKQTRRSSAEVAREKAALDAKRQALLRKQEAELEDLRQLEQRLDAQAQENEAHAARPPPVQLALANTIAAHVPILGDPLSTTALPTIVQESPVRRPPTRIQRRSALGPVVNHLLSEGFSQAAPVDSIGQTLMLTEAAGRRGAAKENAVPTPSTPEMNGGKKRKAEVGGVTSTAKKGRPNKPSGPTAAAAAAFATPASSKRPQHSQPAASPPHPLTLPAVVSTTSPLPASTSSGAQSFKLPHGVYTQTDAIDLDAFEDHSSASVERPVKDNAKPTKKRNIIQLQVVDVTSETHAVQGEATAAAPVPPAAPPPNQPVQPADAAPAVQAAQATRDGPWTMRDLEPTLGTYLGNFTHSFIPKLINLTGNHASAPWSLRGLDLKGAMENLAAEVWPTLTINVIPRQPFFDMVKQKLWEYRNGVGKEAIDVVTAYMTSKRFESAEDRVDFVSWALSEKDQWPFRYERVMETEDGTMKGYGAYQSILVSRVLAYHLKRIGIPADRIRDHPCNALALATTAVERALKMWSTGTVRRPRPHTEEAKFSERLWGKTANEYLKSIIDLDDEQWDKILAKAELCARGLDDDSDDDFEDESDRFEDLPSTGRAVLVDAEVEERYLEMHPMTSEDI